MKNKSLITNRIMNIFFEDEHIRDFIALQEDLDIDTWSKSYNFFQLIESQKICLLNFKIVDCDKFNEFL